MGRKHQLQVKMKRHHLLPMPTWTNQHVDSFLSRENDFQEGNHRNTWMLENGGRFYAHV